MIVGTHKLNKNHGIKKSKVTFSNVMCHDMIVMYAIQPHHEMNEKQKKVGNTTTRSWNK